MKQQKITPATQSFFTRLPMEIADFISDVIHAFIEDRCTRHAAALAFSSLLALAPLLAIGFSLLSVFTSFETLGKTLEDFIYQYLVPNAGIEIREYLTSFAQQAGKLTAVGLSSFFVTALLLLSNIENSLNDIWKSDERRSFSQRVLIYWAMVTLGPILMGASLSMSTYVLSLNVFGDIEGSKALGSSALKALPWVFETLAFFLLYIVMPNSPIKWRYALAGALVAMIFFELTKRGFSIFILNFNNYEVIYGALATLPIFLIWIYLSWIVTLLGAEVVSVLHQDHCERISQRKKGGCSAASVDQ